MIVYNEVIFAVAFSPGASIIERHTFVLLLDVHDVPLVCLHFTTCMLCSVHIARILL